MRTEEIQLKSHSKRSSTAVLMDTERDRVNPLDLKESIPVAWHHKALWVIYNIAATNSLLVSIFYWAAIYSGAGTDGLDISIHLLNSIFMLAETFISAIPVRLLHSIYGFVFFTLYIVVTVFYWGLNPRDPIYPILDYSKLPGLAAGLIFIYILIGLPVAQLVHFGLYKLRRYTKRRFFTEERENVQAVAGSQHITFG